MIQRLKDESGNLTNTYNEYRAVVQSYFCKVFDGKLLPLSDVLDSNRSAKKFDIRRGRTLPYFEPSVVPSHYDLGVKFTHRRPMLAPGEDTIVSDAVKHFPCIFTAIYHPIAVKSVCLVESPIQFKGGMIVDLFKDKGSMTGIENYRDIMLASEPGKAIASTLRHELNAVAQNYASGTQFGSGLHKGSTEFSHLYVKSYIDFAVANHMSAAISF